MTTRAAALAIAAVLGASLAATPAGAETVSPVQRATMRLASLPQQSDPAPGGSSAPSDPAQPGVLPPLAGFGALADDGTATPPDVAGAVGSEHVMETFNTQVRVQSRAGDVRATVALTTFWGAVATGRVFDPRVRYDRFRQRWITSAASGSRDASSSVLIGISRTPDPLGEWVLQRFDVDATDRVWADFPSLGFNRGWIVLQANMFERSTGDFSHGELWVFDKNDLYGAGTGAPVVIGEQDHTLVPAFDAEDAGPTMYLVASRDAQRGELVLRALTGPVGDPRLTTGATVRAPAGWAFEPSDPAVLPQRDPDPTHRIDPGDARIQDCVLRAGSVWCAHSILLPADKPTRSVIQWWQIGVDAKIRQRGLIDDPSGRVQYAYPSLAVNRHGAMLLGFSRFSEDSYPQAAYAFRAPQDVAGATREPVMLRAGEASYYKPRAAGGANRWGDYSATVVDPENDRDFWTLQQYASTPREGKDRWGTWWGSLSAPTFGFARARFEVAEDAGSATIAVRREGDLSRTQRVRFTMEGRSATPDADFAPVEGLLTFQPGIEEQSFTVPVRQDQVAEISETIRLVLRDADGSASLGVDSTAVLVILDDEAPAVGLAESLTSVEEDAGAAVVSVRRVGRLDESFSVNFRTRDDGAVAGVDYRSASGTLLFKAGAATVDFVVPIIDDAAPESEEGVWLELPSATVPIDTPRARLHIRASDQTPDLSLRAAGDAGYTGEDRSTMRGERQVREIDLAPGETTTAYVQVRNDGTVPSAFSVRNDARGSVSIRVFAGSTTREVTTQVNTGTYQTEVVEPGVSRLLRLEIRVASGAATGAQASIPMTGIWRGDGVRRDTVELLVNIVG